MNAIPVRATPLTADIGEIMARRFVDDLYLFDLADEGRIVACRCPLARSLSGESVFGLLDEKAAVNIEERIRSYDLRPLWVETVRGRGVLLFDLIPSATLGILLIPTVRSETEWEEELREEMEALAYPAEKSLSDRILCLSWLTGCPVLSSLEKNVETEENFDGALFDVFLLLTLLLCRRVSSSRVATVSSEQLACGTSVCVRIPLDPSVSCPVETWEMGCLRAIADRKRIPFDYTVTDLFLILRFAPVRVDWSYLGIKQPEELPWLADSSSDRPEAER